MIIFISRIRNLFKLKKGRKGFAYPILRSTYNLLDLIESLSKDFPIYKRSLQSFDFIDDINKYSILGLRRSRSETSSPK